MSIVVAGEPVKAGARFTAPAEAVADAVVRGFVVAAPDQQRTQAAEGVNTNVIGATMWDGPQVVGAVDPVTPPTAGELDAIAVRRTGENCGVKPIVRVVEACAPPTYVDSGEPICADAQRRSRRLHVVQAAPVGNGTGGRGCPTWIPTTDATGRGSRAQGFGQVDR